MGLGSSRKKGRRPAKPLDSERLEALALHYVGRYATSRAKLSRYLERKIFERGWDGEQPADVRDLVERFAKAGYIDDASYAAMRARDMVARGYGEHRLNQRLRADGICEDDGEEARSFAVDRRVESALSFASRRRLGPFAAAPMVDRKEKEKALAAMVRAGHDFALSRQILAIEPGQEIELEALKST